MVEQKKSLEDQLLESLSEEDDVEEMDVEETKDSGESAVDLIKELEEEKPKRKPGRPPKSRKEDEEKDEKKEKDDNVEEKTYKIRKQLDRNMLVPVCSFVVGLLYYQSEKTGAIFRFSEFGAQDEIELHELRSMRSSMPKFLTEPWLIILDDEVVDHLGLNDLYEKILKPKSLDKLFKARPSVMRSILENAPRGMKRTVSARASQLIATGKLDSSTKRKIVEETCGVDLSE